MMKRLFLLCLLFMITGSAAMQTGSTCPAIVEEVIDRVADNCANTVRNEACYGHLALAVEPRTVDAFQFAQVGDIEDVAKFNSIRVSPMVEGQTAWGVALMRLQANLPATQPGQNVTFLLFGDVEMSSATADNHPIAGPMQAFYMHSGIGQPGCIEAPESGVLIQTPQGSAQVVFAVNGIDVMLGSTLVARAHPGGGITLGVLEGAALLASGEDYFPVIAGTQITIPLGDDLLPTGVSGFVEPLGEDFIAALPLSLLDQNRTYATPLDMNTYFEVLRRIDAGEPLCGDAPLPSCTDYPWLADMPFFPIRWGDAGYGDQPWRNAWADFSWDNMFVSMQGADEVGLITAPTATLPPPPTPLPPGCYAGICLLEPAVACQCRLCGVACPTEVPTDVPTEEPTEVPTEEPTEELDLRAGGGDAEATQNPDQSPNG